MEKHRDLDEDGRPSPYQEEEDYLEYLLDKANKRKPLVIEDILNHPERHLHNFQDMWQCSTFFNEVDPYIIDLHKTALASIGRGECDVIEGPCVCDKNHYGLA